MLLLTSWFMAGIVVGVAGTILYIIKKDEDRWH